MEDRYLCKARPLGTRKQWVTGFYAVLGEKTVIIVCEPEKFYDVDSGKNSHGNKIVEVIPETVCQCTGLKDKNGKLIWENDILMCHGNAEDLVKAVFGEFNIINAETLEVVDRVIGWHYEVVPTDALSKCEPFCLPMPLTEGYVKTCEMKVVDNPELLEVHNDGE